MHEEGIQAPHESDADQLPAPPSDVSMEEWLEGHDHHSLNRGDIVRGEVVQIGDYGVMVDVGAKAEGLVPATDLERLDPEKVAALEEGDRILVYCITPEDRQGNIVLSMSQAQVAQDWERVAEMYDTGEIFQSQAAGHNKGGVIVYFGKVRGFVPASQLARRRRARFGQSDSAQPWADLVGEGLWLKVIECDPEDNRLILSEQAAVRQRRRGMREKLLAELEEGDVVTGEITSLADFGAFVDLGGADGLVHISELVWGRVKHPNDILNLGDEVEVQVISIDEERKRIGLSIKRLQPEPWEVIDEHHAVGDLVQGTITKLADFGAFARIDKGLEGLIHISELTDRAINHPGEVVQSGDEVTLRIVRIEPERRRIGLSLRQVDTEQTRLDEGELDQAEREAEDVGSETSEGTSEQAEATVTGDKRDE
ncbi:MAG: 30S ribosomal protein S1 [Anaerolineales bacterium]|nr:30S ribosomal protein S1 [Anaerolineales bacterium]